MLYTAKQRENNYYFWRGCVKPPDTFLGGNNMGKFKGFEGNRGKVKIPNGNFPVKVIEPSYGRFLTLRVEEQNETAASLMMEMLTSYAHMMEELLVAEWRIEDKTLYLTFQDAKMAEVSREAWNKDLN